MTDILVVLHYRGEHVNMQVQLTISPRLVQRARRHGRGLTFRRILDTAAEDLLGQIDESLGQAGFRGQEEGVPPRIWPISDELVVQLDRIAERRGVPRTSLIRALLVLWAG